MRREILLPLEVLFDSNERAWAYSLASPGKPVTPHRLVDPPDGLYVTIPEAVPQWVPISALSALTSPFGATLLVGERRVLLRVRPQNPIGPATTREVEYEERPPELIVLASIEDGGGPFVVRLTTGNPAL